MMSIDKKKVCLISDSTGETLHALASAVGAQFPLTVVEQLYPLVRSEMQLQATLERVEQWRPDLILYTLVEMPLIKNLMEFAEKHYIPAIDILSPLIDKYAIVFGVPSLLSQQKAAPGRQHVLDRAYFERIEAMNFSSDHDDGQGLETIAQADVVILGVSRSSKSPTAAYLANQRGLKVANVPFLSLAQLPPEILALSATLKKLPQPHQQNNNNHRDSKKTLIVGLTKRPEDLVEIRKSRLSLLGQVGPTDYTDISKVVEETSAFKKLCHEQNWPLIDVTHKSIEETAAHIVKRWQDR